MKRQTEQERRRGKITALEVQVKNKQRVSVYLDEQYAFGLSMTIAAGLRRGQILTEAEVAALLQQDESARAYHKSLDFLAYRPRSRQEISTYLQRKQFAESTIVGVLEKLAELGLIDDSDFARQWVENRESFKPRSKRALSYELRQKGVADNIIEQVLEGVDEEESAYRAAQAWAARRAHLDYDTFRRKLWSYLQRKGFGYPVIKKLVEQLWQEVAVE